MSDDPWRCEWGYLHAVPSLAAECDGRAHGYQQTNSEHDAA